MKTRPVQQIPNTGEYARPDWISHYLIEEELGRGTFGRVYLALDTRLDRMVAIKVLYPNQKQQIHGASSKIREAQVMAALDHPNIVPIYDVGETESGDSFIVSKYIDGGSLAEMLKIRSTLSLEKGLRVLEEIARALGHAHERGHVHRDVKPDNIMIDSQGKPFLIDFGLALINDNFGLGRSLCIGTPPYMSPEQSSGGSNSVSGKSDIFSLAVILYEMLTGNPPRYGEQEEGSNSDGQFPIVPPSLLNTNSPEVLDELCLRALSKSPSDRPDATSSSSAFAECLSQVRASLVGRPTSELEESSVVLKGLRCFDEGDAQFYLNLLPGPRDRDGLPQAVARWKERIEATAPNRSFQVGLVYGRSGSGKSSLIRAGVLPVLSPLVVRIVIEANSNIVETLIEAIHGEFPMLSGESDLVRLFDRLNRGELLPSGGRVLVVIDQFEQFLCQNSNEAEILKQALRSCDGSRAKTLMVVRDDFWVSVGKFFEEISVDIDTGRNAMVVDLFEREHATFVLTEFGRSLNAFPVDSTKLSKSQVEFTERAVLELSNDGCVAPVNLALFAEVFRQRPWTVAQLEEIGGMSGMAALFLKDCFSNKTESTIVLARRILQALLPDSIPDLKGRSLTRQELRRAAGFETKSREFEKLLYSLTQEFRLVSPDYRDDRASERSYSLSHDYWVPAVRAWIDEALQKSVQGRAELLLRDRTDLWESCRNDKFLPSFYEWLQIQIFARRRDWTIPQQRMMGRILRRGALGMVKVVVLVSLFLLGLRHFSDHGGLRQWNLPMNLEHLGEQADLTTVVSGYRREATSLSKEVKSEKSGAPPGTMLPQSVRRPSDEKALAHFLLDLSPQDLSIECQALKTLPKTTQTYLQTVADRPPPDSQGFKAKLILHLTGSREDSGSLVGDWLDQDIKEVMKWSRDVLLFSVEAIESAERVFGYKEDRPAAERPDFSFSDESSAKVAAAFTAIGDFSKMKEALGDLKNLERRAHLINFLKPSVIQTYEPWTSEFQKRGEENSRFIVSALVQSIAEVEWEDLSHEMRPKILVNVEKAYRSELAIEHLPARQALQRWGLPTPEVSGSSKRFVGSWFTSSNGIRFCVLPPVEGRRLAVAATELTRSQFQSIMGSENSDSYLFPEIDSLEFPQAVRTYEEVLQFCNEMSVREGLEPCYIWDQEQWHLADNFVELSGYRLPLPAESDFIRRGNTESTWFFGDTTENLEKYVWVRENAEGRPHRVGLLRPSFFGIYDGLGNLPELQTDRPVAGRERDRPIRVFVSGGSYTTASSQLAEESLTQPWSTGGIIGIRLVRTIIRNK